MPKPKKKNGLVFKFDEKYQPANDIIFAILIESRNIFAAIERGATGREPDIKSGPYSQAARRNVHYLLNSIRVDGFVEEADRFTTIDMQTDYRPNRILKRSGYYAGILLTSQPVKDQRYEDVKSACVIFVMSKSLVKNSKGIKPLLWYDMENGEVVSDFIENYFVFVPNVLKYGDKNSEIYMIASFFAVDSAEKAIEFENTYKGNALAEEMMNMYTQAVLDKNVLRAFRKREHFVKKSEKQIRMEEKTETILKMLAKQCSLKLISEITDLSESEILKIAESASVH